MRNLSKDELALRWAEIKPYIDRAVEHGIGECTSMDMFLGAMAGKYECWEAIIDGKTMSFGMARINTFQQHDQLQIVTASGEGWDLYGPEALAYAEDVAKQTGCKYVTVWGRPGWTKKMKPLGYKHTYTVMTKEV